MPIDLKWLWNKSFKLDMNFLIGFYSIFKFRFLEAKLFHNMEDKYDKIYSQNDCFLIITLG